MLRYTKCYAIKMLHNEECYVMKNITLQKMSRDEKYYVTKNVT